MCPFNRNGMAIRRTPGSIRAHRCVKRSSTRRLWLHVVDLWRLWPHENAFIIHEGHRLLRFGRKNKNAEEENIITMYYYTKSIIVQRINFNVNSQCLLCWKPQPIDNKNCCGADLSLCEKLCIQMKFSRRPRCFVGQEQSPKPISAPWDRILGRARNIGT